jgi:hypothetical protein
MLGLTMPLLLKDCTECTRSVRAEVPDHGAEVEDVEYQEAFSQVPVRPGTFLPPYAKESADGSNEW